jgi:Lon protease-like protein
MARILPMFPLGTVLFPYAPLPLHVFEPRYRLMTRRIEQTDREFGVVLIERGSEVGGGDTRFDVGTIARVVMSQELPDGRFALSTIGTRRIRVTRWLDDDPYPQAEVESYDDAPTDAAPARDDVVRALATITDLARRVDSRVADPPPLAAENVRASYEAAALAPIGPLDAQRVLEAQTAATRFEVLAAMLDDAIERFRAQLGE